MIQNYIFPSSYIIGTFIYKLGKGDNEGDKSLQFSNVTRNALSPIALLLIASNI